MTTIAWDGSTLAADRKATSGSGVVSSCTKIRQIPDGTLLAWAGTAECGIQVADWYAAGADLADWPACQGTERWSTLIVVRPDGLVYEYEQLPAAQLVEDDKMAWGSGRLAALAAMDCGLSAAAAVEVAAKFDVYTGCGVNSLTVIHRRPCLREAA